ncbi:hypothetical protein [Pseudogulbenkiania ferrooxidans]|uniref:Uncharacterized protein n=1 Tax=Pseudogulbenkiania ferrooxidans 2002 TaxID=279714 RepID=B9Z4X7_9NEIS|nr:hypothetical protein [Pseudogulbenkiania ferrooxidans]EEG08209.1 hypothetical protein FuraDRAFT_2412 [Pseudogulbenkiania ferrooxidans 2002]
MQLNSPIPPCLAKHGITGVRDNLQPGQAVGGLAKELVRLFGAELVEALRCDKPGTASNSASRSKPLPVS